MAAAPYLRISIKYYSRWTPCPPKLTKRACPWRCGRSAERDFPDSTTRSRMTHSALGYRARAYVDWRALTVQLPPACSGCFRPLRLPARIIGHELIREFRREFVVEWIMGHGKKIG